MKAIKIASGVAVTALAAAISAQANAEMDTETSWSFTGSMEFLTVVDLVEQNNAQGDDASPIVDVEIDEEDDFDSGDAGDGWGLESTLAVTHGPFSANVVLTADDSNDIAGEVNDIIVTDGAISFGEVGSLVDETYEYAYDMDDSADEAGERSEGAPVDIALRYTLEDLGLKVQVEGTNRDDGADGVVTNDSTNSDYGVAAQYMGEADALSYVAEAQLRTSSYGLDDDAPYIYVGAGATYTMDMVTAKVAVNRYTVNSGDTYTGSLSSVEVSNDEAILEYGFEVTATPMEALSVYVKGQDLDSGDLNDEFAMKVMGGAAYTMGMLTFTGEYTYTDVEEAGDEIMANVTYADGPISAYGEVTLANFDAETANAPLIEAGASYTQDNGVVYAVDYDMRSEEADAIDTAEINNIRFSAAYAF